MSSLEAQTWACLSASEAASPAIQPSQARAAIEAPQEERRAKWRAEWTEQELISLAWSASCPKTDYAAILEEIRRERAERALTEPELWGPI